MAGRPLDVVCDQWEPASHGSKACRYYLKPGATHDGVPLEKQSPAEAGLCRLPTEMLCVEWVRRNGTAEQQQALRVKPLTPIPTATPPAPKRRTSMRTPFVEVDIELPEAFKPAKEIDPMGLEALERAGVEVELSAPYLPAGRCLAIVPARTGRRDREEITFREAATVRLIVDAFPGAHVVGFTAAPDGAGAALDGHPQLGGEGARDLAERPFREYPLIVSRCSVCREPQRMTPGGANCANGHGGADPCPEGVATEEDPLT